MKSFLVGLCFLLALSIVKSEQVFPYRGLTHIIGGVEADKGEFPWIVGIRRGNATVCGGSIIKKNWVVTAAHCIKTIKEAYFLVAGDHNSTVFEGTEQIRVIESVFTHRSYNLSTLENDISLLKVSKPFKLNEFVKPVELPSANFTPTDDLTIAGWGYTAPNGNPSEVLLKAVVPFVSDSKCEKDYEEEEPIFPSMMCAGKNGTDTCQVDSGGPLMCYLDNHIYLCGITSWGDECGAPDKPGVYTEVSYFLDWIENTTSSSGNNIVDITVKSLLFFVAVQNSRYEAY